MSEPFSAEQDLRAGLNDPALDQNISGAALLAGVRERQRRLHRRRQWLATAAAAAGAVLVIGGTAVLTGRGPEATPAQQTTMPPVPTSAPATATPAPERPVPTTADPPPTPEPTLTVVPTRMPPPMVPGPGPRPVRPSAAPPG